MAIHTYTCTNTNTHYNLFLAANFRSFQSSRGLVCHSVLCAGFVCMYLLLLNEWMNAMNASNSVAVIRFFYWYYKVHINLMRVLLELFDRYFVKYKCAPNITTVTVHLLGISHKMCCYCCWYCCCFARVLRYIFCTQANKMLLFLFLFIYIYVCAFVSLKQRNENSFYYHWIVVMLQR